MKSSKSASEKNETILNHHCALPGSFFSFLGPRQQKLARPNSSFSPAPLPRAHALPAQAATWAWAGKVPRQRAPPGPLSGPVIPRRRIKSDGRPAVSPDENPAAAGLSPKP